MAQEKVKFPSWIRVGVKIIDKIHTPLIPDDPKPGKWYRVPMDGYVSSEGSAYQFNLRKGTENKLLVFLQGGGVSWNAYMAARPTLMDADDMFDCYYFPKARDYGAFGGQGILGNHADSPFRNWNMISLPYCTGDFHCGTADFPYTALDGSEKVLHHHGAINLKAAIQKAMQWCGTEPDSVVVAGCSAGGFGTALMTDTVMKLFPRCNDFISLIDSGLLYKSDWKEIAQKVWKAPDEICDRLHSDCFTLDCMQALKKEHGDRVKVLLLCSVRDLNLAQLLGFEIRGRLYADRELGIAFQRQLRDACSYLIREIPDVGIYLFDTPASEKDQQETGLTRHCLLTEKLAYTVRSENTTCAEWLTDILHGKIRKIGLTLLEGED